MKNAALWLVAILAAAAAGAWAFRAELPPVSGDAAQSLLYLIGSAVLVGAGLVAGLRGRFIGIGPILRQAAIWAAIFAVTVGVVVLVRGSGL